MTVYLLQNIERISFQLVFQNMGVFLYLFFTSVVLSHGQVLSCPDDQCRILAFPSTLFFVGERLVNHTITNISVMDRDTCEYRCYLDHNCVSVNFYFGENGVEAHNCELNNSTGKEYDEDLVKAANYVYHGTKNFCAQAPCENYGTCQSGFTRKRYRCLCASGYTGHDCEKDIDECANDTHNCSRDNATCTNTAGSFNCSCNSGFIGDGHICQDIGGDAENTSNSSNENAICENSDGSSRCICKPGFSGDGNNCTDIDECAQNTHNCSTDNATCTNTEGLFNCSCDPGFSGDGHNCADIDECATSTHNCSRDNATCTNTKGSFNCSCSPGFTGDGHNCKDIDECAGDTHNCSRNNATCTNTEGSFNCSCKQGFTGNGHKCEDIDECAEDPHSCNKDNATCKNTEGSFKCSCKPGFIGDGHSCRGLLGFVPEMPAESCGEIKTSKRGMAVSGRYWLEPQETNMKSKKFLVYCDMVSADQAWTLLARFSNSDTKNWMDDSGGWWYDSTQAAGETADPSYIADMISPAFWLVSGSELKITRNDDSSHTPLLQTTGNCLSRKTFRSKITGYGDFRNGSVWSQNKCLGKCSVQYGGHYQETIGFGQASCNGNLQGADEVGFWCSWKWGGSVIMIGGGGDSCSDADHGIGITKAKLASFKIKEHGRKEAEFGDSAWGNKTKRYSLNLWIR